MKPEEFSWNNEDLVRLPPCIPEPKYHMIHAHGETPYDRRLRMVTQVARACMACSMCELGRTEVTKDNKLFRDPHVYSNQNPTRFMVVGQNPGWTEIELGEPFVGASGANFDKQLLANGLSRNDFFISNVVRCYTENNRQPLQMHIDRCEPFLRIEINLLRPLLVVVLGALAFGTLCPDGGQFSAALGAITHSKKFDVPVFAIYHPSPLNFRDSEREVLFVRHMRLMCGLVKRLKILHPDACASEKTNSVFDREGT